MKSRATPRDEDVAPKPCYAVRLASAIKRARRRKGWSQRTLAERMGTNHEAIRRLELGRSDPRLGTLLRLFDILNLDFQELQKIALGQFSAKRQETP